MEGLRGWLRRGHRARQRRPGTRWIALEPLEPRIMMTTVDVAVVPVAEPSPDDSTTLPTALMDADFGETYFVELWVQDVGPGVGVTGGQVDLSYTTALANATTVFNDDFDLFPSGTIDDDPGMVDDLGGGSTTGGLGIGANFARLAYVQVQATADGQAVYSLAPGSLQFSLFGIGNIDFAEVDLTDAATVTHHGEVRTVTLNPLKDNTIYEDDMGVVSNGSGEHLFAGTSTIAAQRALMAFDIASVIPAGSTILTSTVTLHMSRTLSALETVSLHRVKADWGEGASNAVGTEIGGADVAPGDATWQHAFFGTEPWATPGGEFTTLARATRDVEGIGDYSWGSFSVTQDVQRWLDGEIANYGWILIGDEQVFTTAKRFDSRENPVAAYRPRLEITYAEPGVTPTTTLPYQDDFDDGMAEMFVPQVGVWTPAGEGNYRGDADPGGNAVALLSLAQALPGDYRINATIKVKNSGPTHNGAIIFDYQGPSDFKFAAADINAHEWVMGHFDGVDWNADASQIASIATNSNYSVEVRIMGDEATLFVDGTQTVQFDFGALLADGQIGLGAQDAHAVFDNVAVEQLFSGAILPHAEDFDDGDAEFFVGLAGTWYPTGIGYYRGDAVPGGNATLILATGQALPDNFQLGAVIKGKANGAAQNGAIIIDYQSATDFKFARGDFDNDLWVIGHFDGVDWTTDSSLGEAIDANIEYAAEVRIAGGEVTLFVDGVEKTSFDFAAPLNTGSTGLGTDDANTVFNDFTLAELLPGEIHGMKWRDLDADGIFDPTDGETPLASWTVFLDADADGQLDGGEQSTTTDADGKYSFTGLLPATYTVAEVLQADWEQTFNDDPFVPVAAERVATGLSRPVFATAPPDDTDRLFIIEQHTGQIEILDLNSGLITGTFLDIDGLSTGNEQGLLGLAFDPNYTSNGLFYVNFTDGAGDTVIRRHQVSANPNVADPLSAATVLTITQPFANHNGGWLGFGPDGFLYIATGDGGSGGDPGNRAQDITDQLLGKILRIDPGNDDFLADPNRNYAIPADNPFVGITGDDEIWAYGLRNPWRTGFDRVTGDFYIADVGQDDQEEINFQPASSSGGENYGWRVMEGAATFDDSQANGNPPPNHPSLTPPIHDYGHDPAPDGGESVVGGYVYRGPIAGAHGQYFFADFLTAQIWSLAYDGYNVTRHANLTQQLSPDAGSASMISSFAEDADGNLYILDLGGEVFKIVQTESAGTRSVVVEPGQIVEGIDMGNRLIPAPLPHYDNFDNGVADYFIAQGGTWYVNGSNKYRGEAGPGTNAVSLLPVNHPTASSMQIDVMVRGKNSGTEKNAAIIFDYRSNADFRFLAGDFDADQWQFGHFDGNNWIVEASIGESIDTNIDYQVSVLLSGSLATLMVDGQETLGHFFDAPVTTGHVGLGARGAQAVFNNLAIGSVQSQFDDFSDGVADDYLPVEGAWFVNAANKYRGEAASPTDNAVSLIPLDGPLPATFHVEAIMRGKPSGPKQNSAIIFDYRNAHDFKFAIGKFSANQWQIGHFDGTDWIVDQRKTAFIDPNIDYQLDLLVMNNVAILSVNGVEKVSFDFGASISTGRVGLGTRGAHAVFDNVTVGPMLSRYFDDFSDGVADDLQPVFGNWSVNAQEKYHAEADAGGNAISVTDLSHPLPGDVDVLVRAILKGKRSGTNQNAAIIFDYQGPTDFKYAGGLFDRNEWAIGHFDGSSWIDNLTLSEVIHDNVDYDAELHLDGSTARLRIDGFEKLSVNFGDALYDGRVGLGTNDANAVFDDVRISEFVEPEVSTPNIIVIVADDLAFADLGSYGGTFIKTPNIDTLRQRGIAFNNYYSHAICSPSRASLMSGQYPQRFGLRRNIDPESLRGLPGDVVTLTDELSDEGYGTYHIGKWHLGNNSASFLPNSRGIDQFFGRLSSQYDEGSTFYNNPRLVRNTSLDKKFRGHTTDVFAEDVIRVLETNPSGPFYMNYWASAPHSPINPPQRWLDQYPDTTEGHFAAMVSTLDENVGKVLQALNDADLSNDTIVMFVSDNGPLNSDRGTLPNAGLRGAKGRVFEGGIKVPMIVRWPGQVAVGSETDEIATVADLFPTIMSLVGRDASGLPFDGVSVLDTLTDGQAIAQRTLFWENRSGETLRYAARQDNWKLVSHQGNIELYDLDTDPSETTDLSAAEPAIFDLLSDEYKQWRMETSTIDYTIDSTDGDIVVDSTGLHFGPGGGVARINSNTRFNPDDIEFSILAGINVTQWNNTSQVIAAKSSAWKLLLSDQQTLAFEYRDRNNNPFTIDTGQVIPTNQLTDVAITLESLTGIARIYIDGVLVTEEEYIPIKSNSGDVTLGQSGSGLQSFVGDILNPRFFIASLLEAEINEII